MKKQYYNSISMIGDGGWGTTLAIHLARNGHQVQLWGAFPDYVRRMKKNRVNSKFLPGVKFPKLIDVTPDLSEAINFGDTIVLAVPSEYLEGVLKQIKNTNFKFKTFLSVVKGIHTQKLCRMSQLVHQHLGQVELAVLSGPTIANEVAAGIPSTAVIASASPSRNKRLQKIFHSETFRIYTNSDMIGVELGGSLKNVIALACGVCDGLGFGTNTKAAILSRGLVEMSRLGSEMGAQKKTFGGLAGLGDLVTTCVSPDSRNRSVGEALGKGRTIKAILGSMNAVAEGVVTAKAVYRLSKKYNVPMPICQEVYNILYKNKKPRQAVTDLMTRQLKAE